MKNYPTKAILLSAGKGIRLLPVSKKIQKNMIPIAGKPILHHIIEELKKVGIKKIGVVVSYRKKDVINYFGDGSKFNVEIYYFIQKTTKGTAHALLAAKSFVRNEPFIVYLADTIIPDGLKEFFRKVARLKTGNLVMVSKINKSQIKSAGLVKLKGKKIVQVKEKPRITKSKIGIAGVYYFNSKKLFPIIKNLAPGKANEIQITDAIQSMIKNGEEVYAFQTKQSYIDMGVIEGLLAANKFLLCKEKSKNLDWS